MDVYDSNGVFCLKLLTEPGSLSCQVHLTNKKYIGKVQIILSGSVKHNVGRLFNIECPNQGCSNNELVLRF